MAFKLFLTIFMCYLAIGVCDRKLNIGYFLELWKYDTRGANYPLPSNVSDPVELLEQEMGPIIPLYDVIIQAFIDPSNYVNGQIVEPQYVTNVREGINGKPGLKELCKRNNVLLMISVGGGGAATFVDDNPQPKVQALLEYAQAKGYAGVDIDEENQVAVDTYANFMISIGKQFKSAGMNISCTIGPLSCCYQSRGICTVAPYIDWVFLMLYDGMFENAAFDLPAGATGSIWQDTDGQKYCGIQPGENNHGIVSFVSSAVCQFIDFALYLNWPANKLIMGMPMYAYPDVVSWFQIMEQGYTKVSTDPVALMTTWNKAGVGTEFLISGDDVSQRCNKVLNPQQSSLGVTLNNGSWSSTITQCSRKADQYGGVTILGVGFWAIGFEDAQHHELSQAAHDCVKANSN